MLAQALEAFRQGQLSRSEELLNRLWNADPCAAIATLQGQVMRAAGRWSEAVHWFQQALIADPQDLRPAIAIGQIERLRGDNVAAQTCFEQVVLQACLTLAFQPSGPQPLFVLGLAYAELEQPDDAIAALQAALESDPTLSEAHRALAAVLQKQGRQSEAILQHQQLARIEPNEASHHLNQALALHEIGENESSLYQLEQLLIDMPKSPLIREAFQFVASTAGVPWVSRREQVAHQHWQQLVASKRGFSASASQHAQPKTPLRVGILTAELGTHPVSFFLEGILRHHNSSQLHLEVIETQPRWEKRNRELRDLADDCILLPQAEIKQRREIIRERNYDAIVETSGFTTASGLPLLEERLAPIQCHYVGFHASTFLPTIDWFIADEILIPPELENQFSERIWRLPRAWAAYTPPYPLPPLSSLPDTEQPVLGSCNQIAKINSSTLRYWAAALREIPQARMLIKHRNTIDPRVQKRIRDQLLLDGIETERLQFEPWAADWTAHMDSYNRFDIALDSTPWSSATTAFEALAMGTPLVAIQGGTMAGRMSSSALSAVGRQSWIADSPETFAAITRELVSDLPGLRAARQQRQLEALASPIFDTRDLTRIFEKTMHEMLLRAQG